MASRDVARKKKKGKGKYYVAGACACAIAIFLAGLGLDFGGLGSGLGFFPSQNGNGHVEDVMAPVETNTTEVAEYPPETVEPEQTTGQEVTLPEVATLITVSGTNIVYDGRTLTVAQLRGVLENIENRSDLDWTLHNEHAILDTISQVRGLLRDLDIIPLETRLN